MKSKKEKSPGANGARKYRRLQSSKRTQSRQLDFQTINTAAMLVLPSLLARWLPGGTMRGREYIVRNPRRTDRRAGSFSVNMHIKIEEVTLAAYLSRKGQCEAARELSDMLGV